MAAEPTDPQPRGQQARLDALRETVREQVAQLRSGDDWRAWLDFASQFRQHPFHNVMAIYAQRPQASLVASYRAWQTMGRQVQHREQVGPGIRVFAPVLRRVPESEAAEEPPADDDERGRSPTEQVVGYRTTHVFDVSQTTGAPLPDSSAAQLRGPDPGELWDKLVAAAHSAGFTIEQGPTGEQRGYTDYSRRAVRIRDGTNPAQAVTTLAHELGHVLAHDPAQFAGPTTAGCHGVLAVEAESVAHLTATHAGLDTSTYTFGPVTEWAAADHRNPEEAVAATGQRILQAAYQLTTCLDETTYTAGPQPQRTVNLGVRAQIGQQAAASTHRRAAAAQVSPPPALARTRDEARLVSACEAAAAFHRDQLLTHPGAEPARRYLTERGLGHLLEPDSPWQVGYALAAWRDLQNHLRGRGFSAQELAEAGLSTPARRGPIDRFRGRIVAPIRDSDGATVAFAGRTLPDGPPNDGPKYLNSPATPIYDKSRTLYGLAEQRHVLTAGARPVLVEGYFDVLAIAAPGQQPPQVAGVASCGTALTAGHIQALNTVSPHHTGAVTAFDDDQAGHAATLRAYDLLAARGGPFDAAQLPAGMDPADMADHPGALRTLLSDPAHLHPLVDVVLDDRITRWEQLPASLETSIGALRSAAPILAELPPGQIAARVGHLADRLDLATETVTTEITEALTDADTLVHRLTAPAQPDESLQPAAQRSAAHGIYPQGAPPARLAGASFPHRPNTPAEPQPDTHAKSTAQEAHRRESRPGTEPSRP